MAKKIKIPVFKDIRGELGAPLTPGVLPFTVGNVFFIRGVPEGGRRGGHAHMESMQLLLCLAGELRVVVDDAGERNEFVLRPDDTGLLIEAGEWSEEYNFASGTVVLVIASQPYSEEEYLRDYASYLAWRRSEV